MYKSKSCTICKLDFAVRYVIIVFCFLLFIPHSVFAQTPVIIEENALLQPIEGMPLYGNYCTVAAGVSLRDEPHTDTFAIDVPGVPVHSYWYWTGRSRVAPFAGDNTIVVDHNASGPQTVTAREAYSSHELSGEWTWYAYFFEDRALEYVASGTNTYQVSGLNINGLAEENHGVGLLTVYESDECPVTRINTRYGLDSFRFNNTTRDGDAFGPDSEVMCEFFEPAPIERTLTISLAVGGVAGPDRGNSLWTYTGSGTPPTNITPDTDNVSVPDAVEIADPFNNNPGREWDFFSDSFSIPAGSTYLCLQIESPEDDRGVSAVWAGTIAAMELGDPAIDIQKTPDMQTVESGSAVTFTIRVENIGNVDLTNVVVSDPLASACDATFALLVVGAVETYECVLENVTADFTNVASVTGNPPEGDPVTDEDDADVTVTVIIPADPAIDIQKTPDMQTVESGSAVTFTIRVENRGNVDLTDVVVSDPLAPSCDATFALLVVGAVETYECVLENVTADFTNVASVTGNPPEGDPVTDEDDADVTVTVIIPADPAIDIQKTPDMQTVESGSAVTFTIRVENIGNVDLTDVVVSDPLAPSCDATFALLVVGAVETYECVLENVTADFTNVASVTGNPPEGDPVTDEDDADVTVTVIIPADPAIDIQKTPDMQTVESGSAVTFTIRVENIGNVDLTNVVVSDPLAPSCDATFALLVVGAVETYECVLENVTADFTNVASVTGNPPQGDPVTDEDDADVTVTVTIPADPAIDIQKTPDMQTIQSGSTVIFTIRVENIGNVDLTNVVVSDPLAPSCDATFALLVVGAVETYECVLENVTADFTNVASVTGNPPQGDPVTDEDDADVTVTVTIPADPAINIQKTPDMQMVESGSTVTFTIRVENRGNVDLTDVVVSDPLAPSCDATFALLVVGAVETYECVLENVTADFTNVASVTGNPPQGDPVTDEDDADVTVTVTIPADPAINIQKTPDMQTVESGSAVTFTIRVENRGNVDLTDVVVSDPLAPSCDATFALLVVGAVETYECVLENVTADFTNVASVTGNPPQGDPVTDEDDADVTVTVTIPADPAIDIQKTPDMQTVESGSAVTFTIRVENRGNVDLTDVVVSDPLAPSCDATFALLVVGAVETYECVLENVTADFTNVASVTGNPPQGDPVTDEDDADVVVQTGFPNLQIVKTDGGVVTQPGGMVSYTLSYTNSGPVDALDVVITERVPNHTTFDPANSDPDWICENGDVTASTLCTLTIGTLPANSSSQGALTFAVIVDAPLPPEVNIIFNEVVIRGSNDNDEDPTGGSRLDTEETPLAPTALEVTGEPMQPFDATTFIFMPILQR